MEAQAPFTTAAFTFTVTEARGEVPPGPVHWKVKVVAEVSGSVRPEPERVPELLQGPPAVQEVAFVEDQVRVERPSYATGFGEAVRVAVGGFSAQTVPFQVVPEAQAPVTFTVLRGLPLLSRRVKRTEPLGIQEATWLPLVPPAKVWPFGMVTVALGVLAVLHEMVEEQVLAPATMEQGLGEALMVPVGRGVTEPLVPGFELLRPPYAFILTEKGAPPTVTVWL